ncbi:DUF6371 domain-containing protein [Mucilaginibacter sp. KACC 22773]|uniref:DUF6965 family protein n=1 Tax=Mucilaginibacter sp. KACC 22773 TaxID=3025671 RepID=UPI002365B04A|nr:DUF6371 domain-containing protein [Mucilaginibacter sp. KACC 22773]WDF79556.1 DUF6371 domain-containing protein [Mucilaginibacter sp. KACC 22773]
MPELIEVPTKDIFQPSYIGGDLMEKTLGFYEQNNFARYFLKLFDENTMLQVFAAYNVGTSVHWPGASIFWQIDTSSRIRTGKIMLFDPITGKYISEHTEFVHKKLKTVNFNLKQCFFGEHLLTGNNKNVAIVDNEKSALVATVYMPEFIWLAIGDFENLSISNYRILKGRNVILCPAVNHYDKCLSVAAALKDTGNFTVSELLERCASDQERQHGHDLADYLVKFSLVEFNKKDRVTIKTNTEVIPISRKSPPIGNINRGPFRPWGITEVETFFKTADLPPSVIMNRAIKVIDVRLMVGSHLEIINSNDGNPAYLPYLDRLIDLMTILKNKQLKTNKNNDQKRSRKNN